VKFRTKLFTALALAALLISPAACGDDDDAVPARSSTNGHRLYVETLNNNGIDYTCIVYDDASYEQGGLWCERQNQNQSLDTGPQG
jgi:hypothetical protein